MCSFNHNEYLVTKADIESAGGRVTDQGDIVVPFNRPIAAQIYYLARNFDKAVKHNERIKNHVIKTAVQS